MIYAGSLGAVSWCLRTSNEMLSARYDSSLAGGAGDEWKGAAMVEHVTRRTVVGGLAGVMGLASVPWARAAEGDPADLLRRLIEVSYGDADVDTIDEIAAEDWVPSDPADAPGRAALKERIVSNRQAFSVLWETWTVTVDEAFATDSSAAARATLVGTGFDGTQNSLGVVMIAHADGGKLVSAWSGTSDLRTIGTPTP